MNNDQVEAAAAAFAAHLEAASNATALALADRLDPIGETQRADLLRRFATTGQELLPADWWSPGSTCQLSVDLPSPQRLGQLWFDPLEAGLAVVLPWPLPPDLPLDYPVRDEFVGWMSLTMVADWQLLGAHLVRPQLPAQLRDYTGENAVDCCVLFGKIPTGTLDWLYLKDGYGEAIFDQLWGKDRFEMGCGAAISGYLEVNDRHELAGWTTDHHGNPQSVDELQIHGYPFRTCASIQSGLYDGPESVSRNWKQ